MCCRGLVVAILLDQDASQWQPEHLDLDPRVAKFAVCAVPRGGGLAASAYGLVHQRDAVTAILERITAVRRRPSDATYREMEAYTLVMYLAGWLDVHRRFLEPRVPPARTDPRHLIVRDRSYFRCQGNSLTSEKAAVTALAELRAAGAKAVPLMRGGVPGTDERRFGRSYNELLTDTTGQAAPAAWEERLQWMRRAGGVFLKLTDGQPGVLIQDAGYRDLVL